MIYLKTYFDKILGDLFQIRHLFCFYFAKFLFKRSFEHISLKCYKNDKGSAVGEIKIAWCIVFGG